LLKGGRKEAAHMNETRNLCAQIPIALHDRVHEEKMRTGKTLNQYITDVLTVYYQNQDGGKNMEKNRTMAFQIPEELFQRIKEHLNRESARTGKKLTQRQFVLGLVERELARAEAEAGTEAPEDAENPYTEGNTPDSTNNTQAEENPPEGA